MCVCMYLRLLIALAFFPVSVTLVHNNVLTGVSSLLICEAVPSASLAHCDLTTLGASLLFKLGACTVARRQANT